MIQHELLVNPTWPTSKPPEASLAVSPLSGFIADGLNVDVRDVSGQTPLMLAAQKDGGYWVRGVHGVNVFQPLRNEWVLELI